MPVPIITIVGLSGSGKTTLIEKLIHRFIQRGFRVGTVKHHMHDFEMDLEGKDTWRHKKAGAVATVLSSPRKTGLVKDVEREPTLDELVDDYLKDMDIIFAEGYKSETYPKLEVHRKDRSRQLISAGDRSLLAVATDEPLKVDVPCFDLDDPDAIADFLVAHLISS